GERPHRILDDAPAVVTGHVVEDHPDDVATQVQLLHAERGGGRCLAHCSGVQDEHDGRLDQSGHLCGAAGKPPVAGGPMSVDAHAVPVVHAHHAFDHGAVGADHTV